MLQPSNEALGLRARGGFTVDEVWADGRLVSATIHSTIGEPSRNILDLDRCRPQFRLVESMGQQGTQMHQLVENA